MSVSNAASEAAAAVADAPGPKHFALTHIVYPATDKLGIPLALLSLSPIFLFVAYFSLVIFGRRLSLFLLAVGSVGNEALSLLLKRLLKSPRPFPHLPHVGHGYGMPSSHTQAASFVLAWGIGYWLSIESRYDNRPLESRTRTIRKIRSGIYLFGLFAWSLTVAASRVMLQYHSTPQVAAGYAVGLVAGASWYLLTEHIPRTSPDSLPGKIRQALQCLWTGVGGVGGWQIGGAEGGWGEGWVCGVDKAAAPKSH